MPLNPFNVTKKMDEGRLGKSITYQIDYRLYDDLWEQLCPQVEVRLWSNLQPYLWLSARAQLWDQLRTTLLEQIEEDNSFYG